MSSAWDGLINDKAKTELPHYAVSKKLPADSYFTSSDTAQRCMSIVKKVLPDEEYSYVEPAAGEGAFYDLFPSDRRIGIELHNRKREEFLQTDFLTWYPDQKNKYVVVGNPPFGVRGAIALAFVNRSLLFAEYVAFILPMSFHSNGKGSNMKRVQNGHLIHSEILEAESFFSPDTNKYIKINSLFQVWKKGVGKSLFPTIDVSDFAEIYTTCSAPDRLCGLDKIGVYDFYVSSTFFGNSLQTVYSFDDVKYGSGYGIIIKKCKNKIMKQIKNVEWNNYASLATNRCKHIRKHSIEKCLYDLGYGQDLDKK